MNLHKLLFTRNECYIAGQPLNPTGIMVHSTGANNPNLRRYVNPDDGLLGVNLNNNQWNQARPDGRQVCVHAFIGKLKCGGIATYQTLPWDMRGWHSGGKANDTHIGFEICEDALTDSAYFAAVYQEAVELCVFLCELYSIAPENVICHSEGHKLGIASNHADVMHWFPIHGKNMDMFRADVKRAIVGTGLSPSTDAEPTIRVLTTRTDNVVHIMSLEEYLRGVVPSEMPASWRPEALKAQAVAARSYALKKIESSQGKPYDVDDTTKFQAYRADRIDPRTDAAIEATRGMILTFNGKTAETVYSASNGGRTRAAKEVWGGYIQYLPAQEDTFNAQAKNGHGVGMSQHGAKARAEAGHDFKAILAFYYPGTEIERIIPSSSQQQTSRADYQALIQSRCAFSDPTAVWAALNAHKFADEIYRKWAESYTK